MITCVYCGGAHPRPADVKRCWAEHQGDPAAAPPGSQPASPAASSPAASSPAASSPAASSPAASSPAASSPAVAPPATPAATPGRRRTAREPLPRAAVEARRGPAALGRNVVVAPGGEPPAEWAGVDRLVIDRSVLDDPDDVLSAVRDAAHAARSLVFELAVDFDAAPDGVDTRPLHELGAWFSFPLDELHHLVWSNSIDARDEAPHWDLVDRAVAAGATTGGGADVILPDGREVWLDGGPVRRVDVDGGPAVLHATAVEHGSLAVPAPDLPVADLAADQLAAVTHAGGAARIIAPAGSGKTRVLTERARQLLTGWRLPAGAVSLVAFNKRAQEEMRARTPDLPGLQVRTLNAIALAIIDGRPPFAPQPRSWRTIDEREVRTILSDLVAPRFRNNTDPLAPWLDALSTVRLALRDPAEVEAAFDGDVTGLAEVWPRYRAVLDGTGAVDFDDQIYRAIGLLVTQPAARRTAQRACRVLLVDEFQDLTPAHLLLVRLLAAPGGAVFGVGDDDQTIYGYNGADPAFLIDYQRTFPGAGDHPLEVNYRCPAGVVEIADRLLRHNRRRVAKTIRAASGDAGGWGASSSPDPVRRTVEAVRASLDAGASPTEVAVLTRVNALIAPLQVALAVDGVPVAQGVGTEFLERTAVRAALAWLRLAVGEGGLAPADLDEASRRPSLALRPMHREWLCEQRSVADVERLAARVTQANAADRIAELAANIERLRRLAGRGATTADLLDVLVDEIGLGGAVATLDRNRHGMNATSQSDDLLAVRQLAGQWDDPATFEGWARRWLGTRRDPAGVVISTVHRVKGQEWPDVVVHLADVDQFPHRLADDPEEERRLFHVAITRAGRRLTLVSGPHPSPFVAELTTEPPPMAPEPPERSRRRSAAPPPPRREGPDHPLLDRERVLAVAGLVLVDQGQEWTITELEPEAAVAVHAGATRRFRIGAKVRTAGRQSGALSARTGDVSEASARLFDLLRQFRERARQGKPAYVVFDDKTLAAIATAVPASLDELAGVKGVGPAKLEQYGDEVMSLAAAALDG